MHELSIAGALVDIACRHARGRSVTVVEVKVGHLRQVVPSALEFAFELVADGTVLHGARLELEEIPARGRCRDCEAESVLDEFPLHCGGCGGFDIEVIAGEELLVDALELEDVLEFEAEHVEGSATAPRLSELTTMGGRG